MKFQPFVYSVSWAYHMGISSNIELIVKLRLNVPGSVGTVVLSV